MKNLLLINVLCFLAVALSAQEKAKPKAQKPSPEAAFTQELGTGEIKVAYARPLARGRKIFGGLVPFDSLWRTGASDCTTVGFNEDLTIGGKKMTAGKYALFTIPTADEWTIVLNSDTTLHGTMGYNAAKDVHRFKVKAMKTERLYETFTIELNDITPRGAGFLNLIWENTLVKIPIESALDAQPTPAVAAAEKPISKAEPMPKMANQAGHNMADMKDMPVDLKTQFAPVLAAYNDLKNALVADNATLAATKGKAMKTALQAIETKSWTAKQRIFYEPLAKKLETDAEHIGDNASKIDHQREHFMTLSNNLTEVTKTFKINTETTYLQFCPMANDGKGAYWLSKEDKVKNPYYGKKMLTCGSVKETLK